MEIFTLNDIKQKFDYEKIIAEQDKPILFDGYTLTEEEFFTSDGTKLLTYVARPVGMDKPLPVILRRTPYGVKSLRFFFEMSIYGYICIMQSCRGCFGSGGEFIPGINEKSDTLDTISWIEAMPDFNGNMAMCGASYLSMEQWQIADCAPPCVKTLYLEFYNPYRYIQLYTNGMFRLEAYAGWTAYNAGIKANKEIYKKAVNHISQINMDEEVLGTHLDWYRDWVSNPDPASPIWHEMPWSHLEKMPERLNLPVFFHCGWYDPHLQGMMKAYSEIPDEIRKESVLLVTPCNHKGTLSTDIELENAYNLTGRRFIKSKLNWFGHMLKGEVLSPKFKKGSGLFYVINDGKHIEIDVKTTKNDIKTLYFDTENNTFSDKKIENQTPITFIYDPKNPAPTVGSEVIMTNYMYNANDSSHGIREQVGSRDDVVSFISKPIEDELTMLSAKVKLVVSTTAEDTAFTAKLCIVRDGKAYHLRESITAVSHQVKNYKTNDKAEVEIEFYPIAVKFNKGDRIRVDVSSSSFPAFHVHPNTKTLWSAEKDSIAAKQTVYNGVLVFNTLGTLPQFPASL